MPDDIYFANLPEAEIGSELVARQRGWQMHMTSAGRLDVAREMHAMHYGRDRDGTGGTTKRVTRKKKGQVLDLRANQLAALNRSIVTLTTAEEPAFEPQAKSTDTDAQIEVMLAKGLLADCRDRKHLRKHELRTVSRAVKYTVAYLGVYWDENAGPEVAETPDAPVPAEAITRDPETGAIASVAHEGDVCFEDYTVLDVAYDYRNTEPDTGWCITRKLVNRYQLAAEHPDKKTEILGCNTDAAFLVFRLSIERMAYGMEGGHGGGDLVPRYDFWHPDDSSCPGGKHVRFLSDGTVLRYEPLEYEEVPVYRLAPEDYDDSPHGHTAQQDLMGMQQALDVGMSHMATKQAANLPRMLLPLTANVEPSDLNVSMGVLKYAGEKVPSILVASASIAEDMQFSATMQKQMETISGVNSVMRGNPEDALKNGSGAALSLIQAQAYLNNSPFQGNYRNWLARVGTAIVRCFQLFCRYPRQLEMLAGKGRAAATVSFSGDKLKGISRITVAAGSAQTQSVAFRMQLLESLMKLNVKFDPQRLIAFVESGKWEVAVEDPSTEDLFIRAENEELRQGHPIPDALYTENPRSHVMGHMLGVLNSLAAKSDPNVRAATMAHIESHVLAWNSAPPEALLLLGIPPPPPPMGMLPAGAPPPAGPEAPAGPAEPPKPPGKPPPAGPPPNGPGGAPPGGQPRLPTMPNGQPTTIPGVTA